MREHVGHGGVGGGAVGGGGARWRPAPGAGGGGPVPRSARAWRVGVRGARGPRPVRPGRVAAAVRPPEVPRPCERAVLPVGGRWSTAGPRVLVRRPARGAARYRLRRAVAGVALVVASAAAVVLLGLLAGAARPGAADGGAVPAAAEVRVPGPVAVVAEPDETVWELASRVAPEISGPRRAALVERIVAENGLTSVRLKGGQMLRVAVG